MLQGSQSSVEILKGRTHSDSGEDGASTSQSTVSSDASSLPRALRETFLPAGYPGWSQNPVILTVHESRQVVLLLTGRHKLSAQPSCHGVCDLDATEARSTTFILLICRQCDRGLSAVYAVEHSSAYNWARLQHPCNELSPQGEMFFDFCGP